MVVIAFVMCYFALSRLYEKAHCCQLCSASRYVVGLFWGRPPDLPFNYGTIVLRDLMWLCGGRGGPVCALFV